MVTLVAYNGRSMNSTIPLAPILHTRAPAPPLADFVDLFWLQEGGIPAHAQERLLPDGAMELVFDLRHDAISIYDRDDRARAQTFPGAIVCGAHSEYFVIDTASQASILGVHFKPGGAFPFLGVPAGDFHGAHVALDALWGRFAAELRDRLIAALTPEAKFRIIEAALLARVSRPLARHPAVAFALREFAAAPHLHRVAAVTAQVGLSPRHFTARFRDEVGLTPKLFCRVLRFQRVVRRIGLGGQIAWADLALDCGFSDQAHCIRDFRDFSGLNPTAYLAQRTPHLNHVPLPAFPGHERA